MLDEESRTAEWHSDFTISMAIPIWSHKTHCTGASVSATIRPMMTARCEIRHQCSDLAALLAIVAVLVRCAWANALAIGGIERSAALLSISTVPSSIKRPSGRQRARA
jgi:hypothetical protein